MLGLKRKESCRLRSILWIAVTVLTTMFVLYGTEAEAVHKGAGDLVCGACHTMHNSQGLSQLNSAGGDAGGSLILLRGPVSGREEIHNLCLQCHASNGSQGGSTFLPHEKPAPKVYINGQGGAGPAGGFGATGQFDGIGSGGDFSGTGSFDGATWTLNAADGSGGCSSGAASVGKGHSIGCVNVIPPGAAEGSIDALSCTNCHDPHGTNVADQASSADTQGINAYRNLRVKPIGGGGGSAVEATGVLLSSSKSWIGGVSAGPNFAGVNSGDAPNHIWPIVKDATTMNAYYAGDGAAETGAAGIAGWCAQCHDDWHELSSPGNRVVGGSGQDWKRHPVNTAFTSSLPLSGNGVTKTDWDAYDGIAMLKKLPLAHDTVPTGTGGGANASFFGDTAADKVFCFSCHFVHGGPYNDNLRWDYTSAVSEGDQTGNAVGSGVGCQICHNR